MSAELLLPKDYINPIDLEDLTRSFRGAEPFPHFRIDDFLRAEFLEEVCNAYPDYTEATALGKEFLALNERGKIQVTDPAMLPEPVGRLSAVLASEPFRDMLSRVTGIPKLLADPELRGGGMHLIRDGGRLDVHVDFNVHRTTSWYRRINILVFLNEHWEEAWGGALELWDPEVTRCPVAALPILNRCMAFRTSRTSFHGVAPVHCPPGVARKSFAAYYYTEEAPPEWKGEVHNTIFRPRPGEHLRNAVGRPLERLKSAARRSRRRVARRKGA
jgi:hypothetical protein